MNDHTHAVTGSEQSIAAPSAAVELDSASLGFHALGNQPLVPQFISLRRRRVFWALKDISFSVRHGEMVGVIGRNGSGKSTLARLMANVYVPDRGSVRVRGQVILLPLGAGLKPHLTGRENVIASGAYLGHSHAFMLENLESIIDFAGVGEFIDQPLKYYSSGMRARLSFSVATFVTPEILILDEVLAAGDRTFREKAEERVDQLTQKAGILFLVAHQMEAIRRMCTRVLWLERGQLVLDGEPGEVLNEYEEFCHNPTSLEDRFRPPLQLKIPFPS